MDLAELNLEWIEAGKLQTKTISPDLVTKQVGVTRIGRDPSRCDVVLSDGSVSGLHIQIGYDPSQGFYVENLRETNPPIVNNQPLMSGRMNLEMENTIQLGNIQIRAIAIQNVNGAAIPPTDIQLPVPPPLASPASLSQGLVAPPPLPGDTHNPNPYPMAPETKSSSKGKNIVIFLLLIGIVGVLFASAWPNIRSFLGIGNSRVIDDVSDSTGPSLSTSNLVSYRHPSGLYALNVPDDWLTLDNSQAGEIVIQGWHHPQLNSYVIVRIFSTDNELNPSGLQDFSERIVDELFGDLDAFLRDDSEPLSDGRVQVLWEAQDGADLLLASTFVQQDGVNLSTLTVWIPQGAGNNIDQLQGQLDQVVNSLQVNANIDIP